jgi:DNA-binding GntR family transcriptional regulator
MNATNAMPTPPVPSFDYSRVARALPEPASVASTPHMLTIAAQLAAVLQARIESGELARGRPLPSEHTLMQRYGVTEETARTAVRALVTKGLAYLVEGRGAYVAWRR